jgi:ribosome-associated protein
VSAVGGRKGTTAARRLAVAAARIAEDNRCRDVLVLDLREVSPVTDYFVIATGSSDRQMRTVADEVGAHGASVAQPPWRVAGYDGAEWILLDFVDVVVHVFDEDHRRFYDLELIWGAAPRVRWRRAAAADQASEVDHGQGQGL